MGLQHGTVVLLDPRWPELVPVAALALLHEPVSITADVAPQVREACTVVENADVLLSADPTHSEVSARIAAGARVVRAPAPPGASLLDAVAVMDRLRSPGGCPWDAEQTHDSLRRYLVEECYELLDALDSGSREHVIEELGDVLLQVLFHARVAEQQPEPFGVDEIAAGLVAKLVHRHPHVFTDAEVVADSGAQQLRWDELKAVEKQRESCVDGVATAQPALALAAKLISRATRAGLPAELVPGELAAVADGDAEDRLRRVALRFAADVRAAEADARTAGLDPLALAPGDWRRNWPTEARSQPSSVEPQ